MMKKQKDRKRLYYCIAVFVFCLLTLSGCGFPILTPDDANVSKRFVSGVKSLDEIAGSITIEYERSLGNDKVSRNMTGSFYGNVSDCVGIDLSADEETYGCVVNVPDEILYTQKDNQWSVYSDAMSVVDPDWWMDVCTNKLSYGGKGKDSTGRSGYILSNAFSGDGSGELLSHLHIPFIGENDASSSDIILSVVLDKLSGEPYEITVKLSKSGSPISVFEDDGTEWYVNGFVMTILFDDTYQKAISIPEEVKDQMPQEPGFDMAVAEDGAKHANEDGILSNDKAFKAGFSEHSIFDEVEIIKGTRLDIHASQYTAGDPQISIKFVSGLDAYNSADSDASMALKYYAKQSSLTDIYVSENVLASSIDGLPCYSYIQQYTDKKYGFVNSEYCTYVHLTDELSLYIKISSMVDPGVSTVLTETYASSVLENVWIDDLREKQIGEGDKQ